MISQEELLKAGFKRFVQKGCWAHTDIGWQLCVRDDKGNKLYFITVAEYDNVHFPEIMKHLGRYSFSPEGQFVTSKGNTFDLTMVGAKSVEQVMEFFAELYVKMNCKPYEAV